MNLAAPIWGSQKIWLSRKKPFVFAILSAKVGILRREQRKTLFSRANSRKTTIINFSTKIKYTGVKSRGGQPDALGPHAAQFKISAAQTRIENQPFFDVLGVFSHFFVILRRIRWKKKMFLEYWKAWAPENPLFTSRTKLPLFTSRKW